MKKKGKFIVIEGTDGSGKSEQVSLLENYFEDKGYDVKIDDYPHYETSVWGKMVGKMLTGEYGDLFSISPYLAVLPYMIDEYWGSQQIKKWIDGGKLVISNRYFTSNVHQVAKLKGKEQIKYREWLWKTGWKEMKILKPDLVIVLLVEPAVSMELVKKKAERNYVGGKGMDLAEKNCEHQQRSYDEYLKMIETDKTWVKVDCCREGKLLSIEEINELVLKEIKKKSIID